MPWERGPFLTADSDSSALRRADSASARCGDLFDAHPVEIHLIITYLRLLQYAKPLLFDVFTGRNFWIQFHNHVGPSEAVSAR